jgi:hypothetical protein
MKVRITLTSVEKSVTNPISVTADVGLMTPSSTTTNDLLNGVEFDFDADATEITLLGKGGCGELILPVPPIPVDLNWFLIEGIDSEYKVDANLKIFVNNEERVNAVTTSNNVLNVFRRDMIRVEYTYLTQQGITQYVVDPKIELVIDNDAPIIDNIIPSQDLIRVVEFPMRLEKTIKVESTGRIQIPVNISWELIEGINSEYIVNANLIIFVNGIQSLSRNTSGTGNLGVFVDDQVEIRYQYLSQEGVSQNVVSPKIELELNGVLTSQTIIPNQNGFYTTGVFVITEDIDVLVRSTGIIQIPTTINWQLFEGSSNDDYVDANMKIYVKGINDSSHVEKLAKFNNESGTLNLFIDDGVIVDYFYYPVSQGGGVSPLINNPKLELIINGDTIISQTIDNTSAIFEGSYGPFNINGVTTILVQGVGTVVTPPTPTPTPTLTPTPTPTPAPTTFNEFFIYWNTSTQPDQFGWGSGTLACAGTGAPLKVYINGTATSLNDAVISGKTFYKDPSRTIELNGGNTHYKSVSQANQGSTFQVGVAGDAFGGFNNC